MSDDNKYEQTSDYTSTEAPTTPPLPENTRTTRQRKRNPEKSANQIAREIVNSNAKIDKLRTKINNEMKRSQERIKRAERNHLKSTLPDDYPSWRAAGFSLEEYEAYHGQAEPAHCIHCGISVHPDHSICNHCMHLSSVIHLYSNATLQLSNTLSVSVGEIPNPITNELKDILTQMTDATKLLKTLL